VIEQMFAASCMHGVKLASAIKKLFLLLSVNRDQYTQQTPFDMVTSVCMLLGYMSKQ